MKLARGKGGAVMDESKYNVVPLLAAAVVGALILEVILVFATGLNEAFTVRQIPVHLVALLIGSLAGWLFELFREMTSATVDTIQMASNMQTSVRAFTARITYQDQALDMLTS
jgi:predicted benzoate:H+ symporter BenE